MATNHFIPRLPDLLAEYRTREASAANFAASSQRLKSGVSLYNLVLFRARAMARNSANAPSGPQQCEGFTIQVYVEWSLRLDVTRLRD